MPSVEQLEAQLAAARAEAKISRTIFPDEVPLVEQDRYAPTGWGATEYDFTCPSGQLCRLKKVDVGRLAEAGIIDKITRLPGLAAELVAKSDGQPPAPVEEMPSQETIETVLEVVSILIPLVVVAPHIWPLPEQGEDRVESRIYVDSVDTLDQIAIMNKVLAPLAKMDSFRKQS